MDVLRVSSNNRLQIAVHFHDTDRWHDTSAELEAHMGMFDILGISRERIILVKTRVRKDTRDIGRYLFCVWLFTAGLDLWPADCLFHEQKATRQLSGETNRV